MPYLTAFSVAKDYWEDKEVGGRTILKWILER
jgi:hypothetical protein